MHLGTLAFCLVLVVAPLAAEAQNLPGIGLLSIGADPSRPVAWSPFLERLRELGYVEGGNITIERRCGAGRPERLDELVADLAHLRVDIIVATGVPENLAAKRAMPTRNWSATSRTRADSVVRPAGPRPSGCMISSFLSAARPFPTGCMISPATPGGSASVLITIRRASRRPDPRRTPRRAHCTWCRDPQSARASTRTSLSFRISRRSSSGAGRAKVGFFLLRMALGVACSHSSPSIRSSR